MGSGGLIAVLAGAAGVGLVLALRQRAADAATTPTTPGGFFDGACEKLKANEAAYLACKAAGGITKIFGALANIGDPRWKQKDDENKALNGEVAIVNPTSIGASNGYVPGVIGGSILQLPLQGSVLRFQNGCVPYPGAPGWEHCKPGTHAMIGAGEATFTARTSDAGKAIIGEPARTKAGIGPAADWHDSVLFQPVFRLIGTGQRSERIEFHEEAGDNLGKVTKVIGDPATGVFRPERDPDRAARHPVPVPAGGIGGYYKGVPFACPAGTLPDLRRASTDPDELAPACLPASELPPSQGGTCTGAGCRGSGDDTTPPPQPQTIVKLGAALGQFAFPPGVDDHPDL